MKKYPIKTLIIALLCFILAGLHICFAQLNRPENTETAPGHLFPINSNDTAPGCLSPNYVSIEHCIGSELDLIVYFFQCWCIHETCFCDDMGERSREGMVSLTRDDNKTAPPPEKLKPEKRYDPLIQQAADQYEVDPAMVKAIIMAESSFNPKAVSKWGARGLMQLMPVTARELGVKDSFNPEHNINGGVKYFSKLMNRFNGDVTLALAAYNAGTRKVLKFRGVPPYKETKNYIKKVIKYYKHYQGQMKDSLNRA